MTWENFFKEEENKEYYKSLMNEVNKAYKKSIVFPAKDKIFYAFELTPLENLSLSQCLGIEIALRNLKS